MAVMNAIILTIGDELVLGQTVDTNSAWLSRQLAAIGCNVAAHMTVSDSQADIEQAIRYAAGRCDCLLVSGGIGPTADDLTRQAMAAVMGVELEPDHGWLARLDEFFQARGRPMPAINRIQAMIPRGADLIDNPAGTASGIHAVIGACHIFILPGVPGEMQIMFERDVLPQIRARADGGVILSRTLHTFGPGESAVAEMLGDLMRRDRNPSVGTTVSGGIISVRINARCPGIAQAQAQLADTAGQCRRILCDLVFGEDQQTLPQAVADLLKQHPEARRWAPAVCTAESCTAGLLAKYLTDVAGSSSYYRQGWVTYTNQSKTSQLGVAEHTLRAHGAVSEPTVREMAIGAATRSGAPFALSISGIAGPEGGTPGKPVGTVCFGLSHPRPDGQLGTLTRTMLLVGDRDMVRDRACKMALTLLRFHLLGKPLPF
jgi:nicotinamide-nucleotide amidase